MNISTIETEVGEIAGRDAIYLDKEHFDQGRKILALFGEFNGALCSNSKTSEFIPYSIQFENVSSFKKVELDDWLHLDKPLFHETSSFYSIEKESGDKIFIFQTYDLVFEISASKYELQLL